MATSKQDFEYQSKDINLLKVSLQTLQEDESRGVLVGLLGGALAYGSIRKYTNFNRTIGSFITVVSAISLYNAYTHNARSSYSTLASICNRNASVRLNEMMK